MEDRSTGGLGVASHDSHKLFRCHILSSVVDLDASVDILAILLVVERARIGILGIVSNVVIHERDDIFRSHTVFY